MRDTPGTPRAVALYWVIIGGLFIPMAVFYGIVMLPSLGGLYVFAPSIFEYAFYASLGWTVLYTIDTIDVFRHINMNVVERLGEWLMNAGKGVKAEIAVLIILYVNILVLIGAGAGWMFDHYAGFPVLGLIFALAYPGLDIHNALLERRTPGMLLVGFVLRLLQTFGLLRGISATAIIRGFLPTPIS